MIGLLDLSGVVLTLMLWIQTLKAESPCKHIEVSGTEYQHDRNGRYTLMDNECNGRQAYLQDNNNNYIYFLELTDGWKGWMIGTSFCMNKGGMAVQNGAESPDQVDTRWEEVYADTWWSTNAAVTCTGALSSAEISGIVIGSIVALVIPAVLILCWCKGSTKKGSIHGTSSQNQRRRVSTVATISRPPNRATVRPCPPPPAAASASQTTGYLGPAYTQPPPQQYPPQGWHSHPIAPPAYSDNPPPWGPPQSHPPQGFAAYPPNSMVPVDQGPPPSYNESQNHQVFTMATVHNPSLTPRAPPLAPPQQSGNMQTTNNL